MTEETKRKISEAKKGKPLSEDAKKHLSEIFRGEGNPNYGKRHSDETRNKISNSLKGRKLTDEQRKKWSEVKMGHEVSEETRKKLSEKAKGVKHRPHTDEEKEHQSRVIKELRKTSSPIWNKGKHLSDEQKKHISETLNGRPSPMKGRKRSEETNRKINETKRLLGTFNTSKEEDEVFNILKEAYGNGGVIRGYSSDTRYPFQCDFYIPSFDLFIECNFHWTHGGKKYDSSDMFCQSKLKEWEEKSEQSKYYKNAIYCWTDLDIRKFDVAVKNSLNYKAYYSLSEIKEDYGRKENSI